MNCEPVDMQFGGGTHMYLRNNVLDWDTYGHHVTTYD